MGIILKAENITKVYIDGQVRTEALRNCNIAVEEAAFTVIVGRSGSGKSTLLSILGLLNEPDEGRVILENTDVATLSEKERARVRRTRIGYIYQDYGLLPEFNGYENIIMPLVLNNEEPDEEYVDELIRMLGIEHCTKRLPKQMSGGEQQRVAIARALVARPAVILADEPTGNLDMASAGQVGELLAEASLKYNQTIVVVTHDKQMADYADVIFNMVDGTIDTLG